MPKITATRINTYPMLRNDKLYKEQEWDLSDGRTVRIETYRDGGTNTLAYWRFNVPLTGWKHIPLAHAKRILKTARDMPELP